LSGLSKLLTSLFEVPALQVIRFHLKDIYQNFKKLQTVQAFRENKL
jgi:hypothetical protein